MTYDGEKPFQIAIRYSVLQDRNNSWILGRDNSFDDYKRKLFDPDRMRVHHELFRSVCLPSLDAMSLNPGLHQVVVFISSEIPVCDHDDLMATVNSRPWLKVIPVRPSERIPFRQTMQDFLKERNILGAHAHVRLDDDDALAPSFPACLAAYTRAEFNGMIVSFGTGYDAIYNQVDKRFTEVYQRYAPKSSMGLAHIAVYDPDHIRSEIADVYSAGKHTETDKRRPTLLDSREPMYLRTIYEQSDTKGLSRKSGAPTSLSEIRRSFPYLRV